MIRILARMLPAQQKKPFSTIPQFEVGEKISIHSKSGPGDPNRATKKIELSANFFKNATKWPKNDQE